jgi:hypothetical protein
MEVTKEVKKAIAQTAVKKFHDYCNETDKLIYSLRVIQNIKVEGEFLGESLTSIQMQYCATLFRTACRAYIETYYKIVNL